VGHFYRIIRPADQNLATLLKRSGYSGPFQSGDFFAMSFFKLLEDAFWCFWGVCGFDDEVVLVFLGFSCASKVFFDVLVFSME
jgi:hypothetical protein